MKNTKICTKCNSKEILRIPGEVGVYGVGNNIVIGKTIFNAVKVTRYLCCECGFSEEWIDNKSDIEKIHNKY